MATSFFFAQELLSTFSTALGEVALQPSTGGTFIVSLYSTPPISDTEGDVQVQHHVLWDRKAEGGFPETKELKRRVRDIIEPGRDLGHVDRTEKNEVAPELEPAEPNYPSSETTKGTAAVGKGTRATRNVREREEDAHRQSTPTNLITEGMGKQDEEMEIKMQQSKDGSICEDCQ